MIKKYIFTLLAILFLSLSPAYAYDKDTTPQEAGSTAASSAVPSLYITYAESAIPNVGSGNQSITLKNPTFQELRDFILRDPTSRNRFVFNQYECRHFATDVNNNAEAEGLRVAFVLLCYARGQHAVVAFDTTDKGLVYIEPQSDAHIHPEVGGKYHGKEIKEILIAW